MPKFAPSAFPRLPIQMTARTSKEQKQKEIAMQEMLKKKSLRNSSESPPSPKSETKKENNNSKTPSSQRFTRSKKEQLKKLERAKRAAEVTNKEKENNNSSRKSSPNSKKSKTPSPKKRKSIESQIEDKTEEFDIEEDSRLDEIPKRRKIEEIKPLEHETKEDTQETLATPEIFAEPKSKKDTKKVDSQDEGQFSKRRKEPKGKSDSKADTPIIDELFDKEEKLGEISTEVVKDTQRVTRNSQKIAKKRTATPREANPTSSTPRKKKAIENSQKIPESPPAPEKETTEDIPSTKPEETPLSPYIPQISNSMSSHSSDTPAEIQVPIITPSGSSTSSTSDSSKLFISPPVNESKLSQISQDLDTLTPSPQKNEEKTVLPQEIDFLKESQDYSFLLDVVLPTSSQFEEMRKAKDINTNNAPNIEQIPPPSVGFTTGRGKKIDINPASMKKAQKMLDEVDKQDKQEIPVNVGFTTGRGKKIEIKPENIKKAQKILEEVDKEDKEDKKEIPTTVGFTTGRGKKIDINPASMKKAQKMLEEVNNEDKQEIPVNVGFTTGRGKKIDIKPENIKKAQKMLDEVDNEDKQEEKQEIPTTVGFTTGRGKKIDINPASIKKAQKILDEVDNEDKREQIPMNVGFTTGRGKKVEIKPENIKKAQKMFNEIKKEETIHNEATPTAVKLTGFQTGTGKTLPVDPKHMKEAEKFFKEIEKQFDLIPDLPQESNIKADNPKEEEEELPPPQGFITGRGKKVIINPESMKKAQKLLKDLNEEGTFKTGNGKEVKVKPESLVKARKLLSSVESNENQNESTAPIGFQTGSGKKIQITPESMQKAKKLMDDVENGNISNSNSNSNTKETVGFTTGRGKKIDIKPESMKKAQKILDEVDKEDKVEDKQEIPTTVGFTTGRGKKIDINPASMKKAQKILDEVDNLDKQEEIPATVGFTTGRGKKIDIKPASMKKAQKILDGVDNEDNQEQIPVSVGFTTGRGKIDINPASMKKAQKILDEVDNEDKQEEKEIPVNVGFTTGRGKKIDIKPESIKKAHRILDEVDNQDKQEKQEIPTTVGFTTGRGKKLDINPESIKKAQKILDEVDNEDNQEQIPVSVGFTTGRGKKIDINPASIKKAQKILDEVDNEDKVEDKQIPPPSVGFTTGRGKKIDINPENMKKAQKMLEEVDNIDKQEEIPTTVGFTTGRGKKLDINPESMKKAQKMFEETDELLYDEAKTPPTTVGFSTGRGKKLDINPESMKKAQKMLNEINNEELNENTDFPPPSKLQQPEDDPNNFQIDTPVRTVPNFNFTSPGPTPMKSFALTNQKKNFLYPNSEDTGSNQRAIISTPARKPLGMRPTGKLNSPNISENTPMRTVPKTFPAASKTKSVISTPGNLSSSTKISPMFTRPFKMPRTVKKDGNTSLPNRLNSPRVKQVLFDVKTRKESPKISLKQLLANSGHTSLPVYTEDELYQFGLSSSTIQLTSESAKTFRFANANFSKEFENTSVPFPGSAVNTSQSIGPDEMLQALVTAGADAKLLSPEWVENHYRWIVWKLACMERCFPEQLGGRYLTPEKVLEQLKYRYEREINLAQRSALKKMLEKDEAASKYVVLCVACIKEITTLTPKIKNSEGEEVPGTPIQVGIIELTDGWYGVRTVLDQHLTKHLLLGKIFPGQKLKIFGAELTGVENGIAPLEATDAVLFKIHINGTRRAPWNTKLGFQKNLAFPIYLRSVLAGGGLLPFVDVVVLRKYPTMFMETLPSGERVTRDAVEEDKVARSFDVGREKRLEIKTDQLRKQVHEELTRKNLAMSRQTVPLKGKKNISDLTQGHELFDVLQRSDPSDFMASLSPNQRATLEKYNSQVNDIVLERIRDPDPKQGPMEREVTPFLKVRLVDTLYSSVDISEAILTIWRPPEGIEEILVEGKRLKIYGLAPGKRQFSETVSQVTTSRATHYVQLQHSEHTRRLYSPRSVLSLASLSSLRTSEECDIVGILMLATEPRQLIDARGKPYRLREIYITDATETVVMISMKVTDHLVFPFENFINKPIGVTNIAYRGMDYQYNIVKCGKTEFTQFLKSPVASYMTQAFDSLEKWIQGAGETIDALTWRVEELKRGNPIEPFQNPLAFLSSQFRSSPKHIGFSQDSQSGLHDDILLTDAAIGTIQNFEDIEISKTGNRCFLVTQAESSRKSQICRHGNLDSSSTAFELSISFSDGNTKRNAICNTDILKKLIDITSKEESLIKQWLRNFCKTGACKREPTLIETLLAQQRLIKKTRNDEIEVLQTILQRGKLIPYDYLQSLEKNLMQDGENQGIAIDSIQKTLLKQSASDCKACAEFKVDQNAIFFTESEWDNFVSIFSSSFENCLFKFLLREEGKESRIWEVGLAGQSPPK